MSEQAADRIDEALPNRPLVGKRAGSALCQRVDAALQAEFGRLLQSEDAKEFQRALQEGRAPVYRGL